MKLQAMKCDMDEQKMKKAGAISGLWYSTLLTCGFL